MAVRIQFRRGTAAEWTAANPTMAAGELGYETDTTKFKIGDGTTNWTTLTYAGVTQADIEAAVESIVGLAPEDLDTLIELAAAIGDDADFANTINNAIDNHADLTTNVHGIPDVSALETQTGAQTKADAALSAAQQYADNAVANLVASAPSTLNTLNELANALGDDPNFATTVTNSLAEKLPYIADTITNLSTANAVTELDTVYIVGGIGSGYLKIGDNINHWNDVPYVGQGYADQIMYEHNALEANVHGISDSANLAYQVDVANALAATEDVANSVSDLNNTISNLDGTVTTLSSTVSSHTGDTLDVHGIANTADLVTSTQLASEVSGAIESHNENTQNVHGIANTAELVTQSDLSTHAADTLDVHGISNTANLVYVSDLENSYAPLSSPTFSGTVALPSTTSIGDISALEISALDNVASNIQTQLDAKLAASVAETTYAPIANASFVGEVSLPALTSIGDVSATEIGYLNNVSSSIQTQLDAKAPTESPTFTGTVSGVTAAMVGLGDVDNTADLDKPISTATQTALDGKANLSGATFTGDVEAIDLVVTGNLIVQGTTTTIHASDLSVKDNMIYLNQAGVSTITDADGDGTNVIYTTSESHGYDVGDYVTVANTTPSSFNVDSGGVEILAVTANTFTIASTVTDTYVSGGTARGKTHANPDLGWAAGRYDTVNGSGYAHTGLFRDATDGVFKFFDGYVPEPDESAFIDTSHGTFSLADLAVHDLTAANVSAVTLAFGDGTVQNSAGVPSLTSFVEKTSSYTLDGLSYQDKVVEMNSSSAVTFTIPTNANLAWPIGASMDILQTGSGQVTISPASGVTLNYTPGNKLRTQWSSCTIMKRSTDSWILYGDLTA